MLADYVAQGGKLLVMAGPVEDASLDNLNSLLTDYGVTVNEGIVVEGDREHYALQSPLALMPDMSSNDITDPLIEERYYQISGADYLALMAAGYDDLRHTEILPADFEDLSQVDVTLDGVDYTLTLAEEEEGMTLSYQDQEVEITDFQTALETLAADSFTGEQPTGQEEIALTVHLDLEGQPTVSIVLYRYDGSSCLAVVDGQPTALVARSAVVDLVEAVNAVVLN